MNTIDDTHWREPDQADPAGQDGPSANVKRQSNGAQPQARSPISAPADQGDLVGESFSNQAPRTNMEPGTDADMIRTVRMPATEVPVLPDVSNDRAAASALLTRDADKSAMDDALVANLDARMARSKLEELGWRDRPDLTDVMRDLERLAGADWRKAAMLWDKYRPDDEDKPIFIDGDDKDPLSKGDGDGAASGSGVTQEIAAAPDAASRKAQRDRSETAGGGKLTVPKALAKRYLVAENKFYFRDDPNLVAFEDKGKRLSTEHDDPMVARSMVELAEAKRWTSIKVKGTNQFRREVWKSASRRGLDVQGYAPSDVEKAELAEFLKELQVQEQNAIEQGLEPEKPTARFPQAPRSYGDVHTLAHSKGIDDEEARINLTKPQRIAVDTLRAILTERGDSAAAVEMATQLASERFQQRRVYVGRLLAHGAAPYNNDPKAKQNYFVTLKTIAGERTVWGIDLERALSETAARPGDDLAVVFRGKKRVMVQTQEQDGKGHPTGRHIETEVDRNTWEIGTLDKMREEARQRIHKAASQTERAEPTIPVYGPAPKPQRTTAEPEMQRAPQPTPGR